MPLLTNSPRNVGVAGRARRAALTSIASLLLTTCTDNPSAPGRAGMGQLRVFPTFDASATMVPLALDNIRILVIRPPNDTIKTVTQSFPANQNQIQVTAAQIPLQSTSEDLIVVIELYSGTTLLFSGTDTITVEAGVTPPAAALPVSYAGPGANLDSLAMAPRDTVVLPGAVVPYSLQAFVAGSPLSGDFYVTWSASAGAITTAGVYTAPTAPGTYFVRAASPTATSAIIRDSTTIEVRLPPAIVIKTGGDVQSGLPGGRLPAPLQVRVDDSNGQPVQGVDVTFAPVTGGGSVDNATVTTDANGLASTGVTLGQTSGQQTFSATASGLNTVTFTATALSGILWTGAVDNNWQTAGNWIPSQVPGLSDDVTIPVTGNQPVVSTTANLNNLTINAGATVTLATTFTFNVAGNLAANGNLLVSGGTPTIQLSGTGKALLGQVANASITGTIALAGNTTVSGNVAVSGGTATLDIGISLLNLSGNFSTGSGGRLIMTTAGGQLNILGSAAFGGGDENGALTAGTISIAGNFSQTGSGNAASFAASGSHSTGFIGAAASHTVNFGTPGAGTASSHFNTLDISSTATVSLATDAFANGLFLSTPSQAAPTLGTTGVTHKLTAAGVSVTGLNVNQATFGIGAGPIVAFNGVQFSNMPTTVAQLTVNNPGAATPFSFTSLSFATPPVGPNGFYMDVTDADGATSGILTINMPGVVPTTPGGFLRAAGGAIVNWPVTTPVLTWDGSADGNWGNAANWTPAQVPTNADDVLIPSGTPNDPTLSASCSAKSLTVNALASLSTNGVNCQVLGNVFADGAITGLGAMQIAAAAQIRGTISFLQLSGAVTAVGPLTVTDSIIVTGTSGRFAVNGQVVTVATTFTVQSGARLIMTNVSDQLTVSGNALFAGGFELDSMSAGTLSIGGNLTQVGTGSLDSFHPSGLHQTIFTGASATITFGTPGDVPGSSHFQNLSWTGTGTLTLGSDVFAHSVFTATSGTISGSGGLFQFGSLSNSGHVTFNNVRVALVEPSGGPLNMSNATFQGLASTLTQLSVSHPGTGGPFTFNALTFSVTATGVGRYLSATDNNAADGTGLVINVTNTTPTSPGAFVAVAGGAVVNWPPVVPIAAWTGTVSTDWSVAGNWSSNSVPTSGTDVTIAAATNSPTLTTNSQAKSLTVNAGGLLTLNGFTLQVSGNVTAAAGGIASGGVINVVAAGQVTGTLPSLTVAAAVTIGGPTSVTGDLTISGAGANLTLSGQTVIISGNLVTASTGTLTMNNANDAILVINNASFGGGASVLTGGVLQIEGSFTQTGTNSFAAGGNHLVQLVSSGQGPIPQVSFATPGTNRFQNLDVTAAATVTIASNVTVAGQLISVPVQVNPVLQSLTPGRTLTAGGAVVTGLVMDGVPLILSGGIITSFSGVTFSNQSPIGTGLTVNNTGAGGPFSFNALNFTTGLTAGGFHLVANDLDGPTANGALTINVSNASPASGTGVSQANNGAIINWVPGAPIWDGSQGNSDWNDPLNWSTNLVPGPTDSVVIPSVGNQPVLAADVSVGAVNVSGGNITINRNTLTVARTFATTGIGTLTMNLLNDRVDIGGNAIFAGGGGGALDSGIVTIGGNFTQLDSNSPASYAATCGHQTEFINSAPTISFATPGPSHFGTLLGTFGQTFTLGSSVTVECLINGGDGFGGIIKGGGTTTLTAQQISGGMTVDGVQLVLNDPTGIGFGLSNVDFVNQPNTAVQLTVIHPGFVQGTGYSLGNINWTPLTSGATGFYLSAVDPDGGSLAALIVDISGNNPGNGPAFTKTDGTATVTWQGAPIIWSGGSDNDSWTDGSNWVSGVVPTGSDNVQIPAGTPFDPRVTGTQTVKDLSVLSGATLVINDATLQVLGSVTANGTITQSGGGSLSLAGAGQTALGTLGPVSVEAGASYSLSGPTFADNVGVSGVLNVNGSTLFVGTDFNTNGNGVLVMQNPSGQVIVTGNAQFNGGSTVGSLTEGSLSVGGSFFQTNTTSTASFFATGNHVVQLIGATPQIVNLAGAGSGSQFSTLIVGPGGMTAQTNLQFFRDLATGGGPINMNGNTFTVSGNFSTSGAGTLVMQNAADFLDVTGAALFAGGSTAGLMTNGVLRLGAGLDQRNLGGSDLSFAPSALHRTLTGTTGTISFQTPGTGAGGSHFNALDVTGATGGVAFTSAAFVDSALIASVGAGAPKISGSGGLPLTAKQWLIQGLQVTNVPMVLNEGGVTRTHTFNGVSFLGFPTTPNSVALIDVTAVGSSLAARTITFTGTQLQMSLGTGGLYVRAAASNAAPYTLIMSGSNDPTGGLSRSQQISPAAIQYQ